MKITAPTIERQEDGYRLVYEDVYATDIDDLWEAVTTRERLARWMVGYDGELRLGGEWWVEAAEGEESWARGVITSCNPPHSFTSTWHAIGEAPTELTVTLEAVETGTRLRLVHTGIRSIFYGAGWHTYLERLADEVAGQPVTQDWQTRFAELSPTYEARFGAL